MQLQLPDIALTISREGMGAALVLAVLIAYLRRTGLLRLSRQVLLGAGFGTLAGFGVALLAGGELALLIVKYEALAGIVVVALTTQVIFWMAGRWRNQSGKTERADEYAPSKRHGFVPTILAFILLLWGGFESTTFTTGTASAYSPLLLLAGQVTGWSIVFIVGWLLYKGLCRLIAARFFACGSLVLAIFSAGILGEVTPKLEVIGWLPGTITAWDSSRLILQTGILGGLLNSVAGYTAAPSVLQVIFYFAYLALVLFHWLDTRLPDDDALPYGQPFRPIGTDYSNALYGLLRERWMPLLLLIVMAILFVLIMGAAFFPVPVGPFNNEGALRLGRFATDEVQNNLFSFVMWIVWLPLLTLSAIFVGRLWCGNFCPLRWVSDLSRSLADRLFRPIARTRRVHDALEALPPGVVLISLFILITLFVRIFHVQEVARYGAILFLGLTALAVLISMLFRRGTWCHFVCPIGGWLARISRLSILGLRARHDICATCQDKPCLHGTDKAHPCPTFLNPSKLDSSRYCLDCWNCVKNCPQEMSALKLGLRAPGTELMKPYSPLLYESVFVAALIGMYVASARQGKLLESWPYPLVFFSLMAVSVVAYFILCSLVKVLGRISFREALTKIGYVFLPLEFGMAMIAFGDETLEFLGIMVPAASIFLGLTFIWSLILAASILRNTVRQPVAMWLSFVPVSASIVLLLMLWLNWYAAAGVEVT